jgi:hypothetical protein
MPWRISGAAKPPAAPPSRGRSPVGTPYRGRRTGYPPPGTSSYGSHVHCGPLSDEEPDCVPAASLFVGRRTSLASIEPSYAAWVPITLSPHATWEYS